MKKNNYVDYNAFIFENWKEEYDFCWMKPITHADFLKVKDGENLLTVTPNKKVPFEWYKNCKNKKVLGLAAGGGQQMPIFAALGANCTLIDASKSQIENDLSISIRENYDINLINGDISQRLPFDDESFDIVINPISNHYIENIYPMFKEIYRVLKHGGLFILGFETEIFWTVNLDTNKLEKKLPINPLKNKELYKKVKKSKNAFQFSHTTTEQIGGQLNVGFRLIDIYDDIEDGIFSELNIPTFMATLSIKD